MSEDKVKIITATYDADKELAKVKVLKLDTDKEVIWALTAEGFDSLIGQISGKHFRFTPEQKIRLCQEIIGLEFNNQIKIDIDNPDVDGIKDRGRIELQHYHDTIDMYPFYEVQQEAIEEAMHGQEGETHEDETVR